MTDDARRRGNRPRIYVCTACGRTAPAVADFNEVSCAMHAVACFEDSIERNPDTGLVVRADGARNS